MTPDGISFHLPSEALISISQGQVHLLLGSEWHDLTGSNLGNFLLASQFASGLGRESSWPKTSRTIQYASSISHRPSTSNWFDARPPAKAPGLVRLIRNGAVDAIDARR